jgi:predicted PurR-regulated permease PerM
MRSAGLPGIDAFIMPRFGSTATRLFARWLAACSGCLAGVCRRFVRRLFGTILLRFHRARLLRGNHSRAPIVCVRVETSTPSGSSGARPLLVAIAVVVLLLLIHSFRYILLAGIIGVMGGVLLAPLIRWLQHRMRLSHGLSVLATVLLLVAVLVGIGYGVVTLLSDQAARLAEQGPAMLDAMRERIGGWMSWFGGGENVRQIDWPGLAQKVGKVVLGGAKVGVESVGALVVVLAIAVFTAANAGSYLRGLLSLFPPARRAEVERLGCGSATVLRRWLGCQLIVVSISAALTAVTLGLIGFDYWLLVALLTIVLDFVPLLGALITGGIAASLTLATEPEKVWWVILAYVVIQQVETDVTLPLVMKGRIRLPEVPLLVFVMIMGSAFGVAGIFAAPPIFAILHHLYVHAYVPRIEARKPR